MTIFGRFIKGSVYLSQQKYFVFAVLCLAFALVSPSLNLGFQSDDWYHKLILTNNFFFEYEKLYEPGLFAFFNGQKETIKAFINIGILPWWTFENLSIQFFRPISDLSHSIDYWLWPNSPLAMHLENILLYLLIIGLCFHLYLKLLPSRAFAALAILLFALDSHHGVTVSWIANRNALLASLFALLCIIFHHQSRSANNKQASLLSIGALALALLSAEYGITVCAYLFAYQMCIDPDINPNTKKGSLLPSGLIGRVLPIVPHGLVVLVWLSAYKYFGFGETGSGAYADPLTAPLSFLQNIADHLFILFSAQLSSLPTDLIPAFPKWLLASLIGITLICIGSLATKDKYIRFWSLSVLVSLIPLAATLPNSRVLIIVSVGFYGLLAQWLFNITQSRAAKNEPKTPSGDNKAWLSKISERLLLERILLERLSLAVLILILCIHLSLSPLLKVFCTQLMDLGLRPFVSEPAKSLPIKEPIEQTDLVMITTPLASFSGFINLYRKANDLPIYRNTWMLSSANEDIKLVRTQTNAFTLEKPNAFLSHFYDFAYRSQDIPFKLGDIIQLNGPQIKIIEIDENQLPTKIEMTFDRDLDDESLAFVFWDNVRFKLMSLPEIGFDVVLKKDPRF